MSRRRGNIEDEDLKINIPRGESPIRKRLSDSSFTLRENRATSPTRRTTSPTRNLLVRDKNPIKVNLLRLPTDLYRNLVSFLGEEGAASLVTIAPSLKFLYNNPLRLTKRAYSPEEVKDYFSDNWNVIELKIQLREENEVLYIPPFLYTKLLKLTVLCYGGEPNLSILPNLTSMLDFKLISIREPNNYIKYIKINNPPFPQCPRLTQLTLDNTKSDNNYSFLKSMPNLIHFTNTHSNMSDTSSLVNCINLIEINLEGAADLQDVSHLEKLAKLTKIRLADNPRIINILDWQSWINLEELSIELDISEDEDIPNLSDHKRLKILKIQNCTLLPLLPDSLTNLEIESKTILDIDELDKTPNLKKFRLVNSTEIKDLSVLENCPLLEKLSLESCLSIINLIGLDKCSNLKKLRLYNLDNLASLKGLHDHIMKEIIIEGQTQLTNMHYCPDTTKLILNYCFSDTVESMSRITNFNSEMEDWKHIEELAIRGVVAENFSAMEYCRNLKKLIFISFASGDPPYEGHTPRLMYFPLLSVLETNNTEYLISQKEGSFFRVTELNYEIYPANIGMENKDFDASFLVDMFPNLEKITLGGDSYLSDSNIRLSFLNDFKRLKSINLNSIALTNLYLLQDVTNISELKIPGFANLKNVLGLNPKAKWTKVDIGYIIELSSLIVLEELPFLKKIIVHDNGLDNWGVEEFLSLHPKWKKGIGREIIYDPDYIMKK